MFRVFACTYTLLCHSYLESLFVCQLKINDKSIEMNRNPYQMWGLIGHSKLYAFVWFFIRKTVNLYRWLKLELYIL